MAATPLIRSATPQDIRAIWWLVLSARLDPTQLRWQQFWVMTHQGKIVACGQLRSFPDAQELGSLVVDRQWRYQGLGRRMVQYLIAQSTQPLYLECLGTKLVNFYTSLGFVSVGLQDVPPELQNKFRRSTQIARWLRLPLALMVYGESSLSMSFGI